MLSATRLLNLTSSEADSHRAALALAVNSDRHSTWKAAYPPVARFAGKGYETLAGLAGILGGSPAENEAQLPVRTLADVRAMYGSEPLPEAFDAVTAWPQCPIIAEIRDQSACGSCYAVSAASVATDRFCIHHNGTKSDRLSDVDLMSCCKTCASMNGGCNGGTPSKCWDYISSQGIATGGKYGDKSMCLEYPFASCDHHVQGSHGACPDQPYFAPTCFWACDADATGGHSYDPDQAAHRFGSSYKVANNAEAIQRDILANGPVQAGMWLTADFEIYSSGVFTTTSTEIIGGHAVRIVGWGIEQGMPYWTVANSWNDEWGEAGRFRIERGKNVLAIEEGVVGGTVAASRVIV
jgi:cathepsin B